MEVAKQFNFRLDSENLERLDELKELYNKNHINISYNQIILYAIENFYCSVSDNLRDRYENIVKKGKC